MYCARNAVEGQMQSRRWECRYILTAAAKMALWQMIHQRLISQKGKLMSYVLCASNAMWLGLTMTRLWMCCDLAEVEYNSALPVWRNSVVGIDRKSEVLDELDLNRYVLASVQGHKWKQNWVLGLTLCRGLSKTHIFYGKSSESIREYANFYFIFWNWLCCF